MGGSGLLSSAQVIELVSAVLWSCGKLFGCLWKVSPANTALTSTGLRGIKRSLSHVSHAGYHTDN